MDAKAQVCIPKCAGCSVFILDFAKKFVVSFFVAICLKMYILHPGHYFNTVLRPKGFSVISLKGSLLTLHS